MRTWVVLLVLLVGLSPACLAWGFLTTHPTLTGWALLPVANPVVVAEIALNASGPDVARDTGGCSKAPCGADVYGHRATRYLLDKKGHYEISRYGRLGAELGAWQFAEQARTAYKAGNGDWKKYLGWATHYLADALCPAHCCPSPCATWTGSSPERESVFEAYFEVSNASTLTAFVGSLQAVIGGSANFYSGTGIRDWVDSTAQSVAALPLQSMSVPPYLSPANLAKVFGWIGAGIRGLYTYVTK